MGSLSDHRRRGAALLVTASLLLVLTFGGSWALSKDTTALTADADGEMTTLVGVQGPGPTGNVTELDANGTALWTMGDAISYLDVSYLENGSVLATYTKSGFERCGRFEPPCKRTGVRIIETKPEPRVVAEWSYPIRTRKDSEVHDAEFLPSGELLVADMEYESIFAVDMRSGERSWTWNASEFYDAPADPTREDWLHINDVDFIGENRYLVSVRNTNQLLVLERNPETNEVGVVEVINEDRDPDVLNQQHNPHWVGDGAVVVADSENDRVVELHRGESGEWRVVWQLSEVDGIPLDWPRDADRLPNGNTLITDSRNDRVVEVSREGDVVASYTVQSLPYEADRVSVGESGGEPYDVSGDDVGDESPQSRDVPVLSLLLDSLHHVLPVPYWLSELHLAAAFLAVGLSGWGTRLLLRG
ncbi:aryl-sulfate sulfotransferase [Haloprofundus halobius]|uniref:aryl-sulfate sulfotransferase n=1 Tax=Haloprofundus halobius TaxID=2876194 RepID=UPI001CCD23CA|nr:aryl-sulfate sulfotransferase [Haloprofundus halobius]